MPAGTPVPRGDHRREEADQHAEDHERGAELARWHDEDQAVDEHDTTDEHVLEVDAGDTGR